MCRDRPEVGRHVHRPIGAAVDAADPAGGEDLDPRLCRDLYGRGDGRRSEAIGLDARQERREVPGRDLRHAVLVREPREERVAGADDEHAVGEADRRRDRAGVAHVVLEEPRGLEVLRSWQSVRDDGRLERDDASPRVDRLFHAGPEREPH